MPDGNIIGAGRYATRYVMPAMTDAAAPPPQREPPLRGPWPVWALAGAILLSYALQSSLLDLDLAAGRYGVSGLGLKAGHWTTLVSALFIHGGWAHAGMNAVGALAFGAPVARTLGLRAKGVAGFFLLYLLCGVIGNLGYVALHPDDSIPLAGASGAVAGLFGAASRMLEHRPSLSPFRSRTVIACLTAWIVINAVFGLMHYAPGIGDAEVGWQAHIAGYLAGLLLIGPFVRLFGPSAALREDIQTAPD